MKLSDAVTGKIYKVGEINIEDALEHRLMMLGLTHGTNIELLERKGSGSCVIKVRSTRFAIGRQIADGIEVTE